MSLTKDGRAHLGLNLPRLSGKGVMDNGARDFPVSLNKRIHSDIVCNIRSVGRGRQGDCDVELGVITLAVVVNHGGLEIVLLQEGEGFDGLVLRQEIGALQVVRPGHQVIGFGPGPIVWNLGHQGYPIH